MARKKPLTPDSIGLDFHGWQWEPWDFQWQALVIDWPGIDWGDWGAVDWPEFRGDFWDPPDPEKP